MRDVTLEELLEKGAHFGHQITRGNPKAREFVFGSRDGIQIIDLAKTRDGLIEAANFIKNLAEKNGVLIIVGTKRQARPIVEESIRQAQDENSGENLFYITNRWVGGLLTNFPEVSKNFKKYSDLVTDLQDDELKSRYTKKEVSGWEKEKNKLEVLYGGVAKITKKPDGLFIIDSHLEHLAVHEAIMTGVPTAGIVDTNADPAVINYPIPANDDAVGSIKLIVSYIMDAWIEGRKLAKKNAEKNEKTATAEITEKKEKTQNKKNATTESTEKKEKKITKAKKTISKTKK